MDKYPGYWISQKRGAFYQVDDHAKWVIKIDNAKRLEITDLVYESICDLCPVADRIRILVNVLASGFIRMRDHGSHVTLEFASRASIASQCSFVTRCLDFLENHYEVGEYTDIVLNNISMKTGLRRSWKMLISQKDHPERIIHYMERIETSLRHNIDSILISTCFEEMCILPQVLKV